MVCYHLFEIGQKNRKMIPFGLLIFLLSLVISCKSKTSVNAFYYPWELQVSSLQLDESDSIPVCLDGTNYRIICIENFEGSLIKSVEQKNKNLQIELSFLPQFEDYSKKIIIDAILPLRYNENLVNFLDVKNKYFLLEIKGLKSGTYPLEFKLFTDKKTYVFNKKILVSKFKNNNKLDINAWPYFDYNFMLKGAKQSMVDNLISNNLNVIVIPPYALPHISESSSALALDNYLKNTNNEFDYYLIYFGGFQSKTDIFLTTRWMSNYKNWILNINSTLLKHGISNEKIFLYPYDEPHNLNVDKFNLIVQFSKKIKIQNDFFLSAEDEKSINNCMFTAINQLHSGQSSLKMQDYSAAINVQQKAFWIYETKFGRSRAQSPINYLAMGWKSSKYKSSGIGLWNYCDVENAYNESQKKEIAEGKASWEIIPVNPDRDYSLVYRRKEQLYSSLRQKALSQCNDEIYWLDLYGKQHSLQQKISLTDQLINRELSFKEWENIKMQLLNK
jgi:hypothetical protein